MVSSLFLFIFLFSIFIFYLFIFSHVAYGILLPQLEIEPASPAVETWSLNHWTAREFPIMASSLTQDDSFIQKILLKYLHDELTGCELEI